MEQHWEHKIADAYRAKDENSIYPKKDELWARISNGIEPVSYTHLTLPTNREV